MHATRTARAWRAPAVGLLLMLAAVPLQAQNRTFAVKAEGDMASRTPLTRSALRTRVAESVKVNYQGPAFRGRVVMVLIENGQAKGMYESAPFTLNPGETAPPTSALPDAGWFPDGATPSAAFSFGPISWIADWIFGKPEPAETNQGDEPPPCPPYSWCRTMTAANSGGPTSGTVLAIAIVPFGAEGEGKDGSMSVSGVGIPLGGK
jgi:hypothetical protein